MLFTRLLSKVPLCWKFTSYISFLANLFNSALVTRESGNSALIISIIRSIALLTSGTIVLTLQYLSSVFSHFENKNPCPNIFPASIPLHLIFICNGGITSQADSISPASTIFPCNILPDFISTHIGK